MLYLTAKAHHSRHFHEIDHRCRTAWPCPESGKKYATDQAHGEKAVQTNRRLADQVAGCSAVLNASNAAKACARPSGKDTIGLSGRDVFQDSGTASSNPLLVPSQ